MPLTPAQEKRLRAIVAAKGRELRPETVELLWGNQAPRTPDAPLARIYQGVEDLTEREIEVLQYAADGLTSAEIAQTLSRSEQTIKSHIAHVLEKLDARSRTHAVAIGFRQEIIF